MVPGRDYVLTEVVHCKSLKNIGVPKALSTCRGRWLRRILDGSGAKVVAVLGKHAAGAVRAEFGIPEDIVHEVVGKRRIVFLGAPSSSRPRKLKLCIPDAAEQAQIRAALSV